MRIIHVVVAIVLMTFSASAQAQAQAQEELVETISVGTMQLISTNASVPVLVSYYRYIKSTCSTMTGGRACREDAVFECHFSVQFQGFYDSRRSLYDRATTDSTTAGVVVQDKMISCRAEKLEVGPIEPDF